MLQVNLSWGWGAWLYNCTVSVRFIYSARLRTKSWLIIITYWTACLQKMRIEKVKPWQNFHLRKRKMWIWQALHIGVFLRCQSNQVSLLCAVTPIFTQRKWVGKIQTFPMSGQYNWCISEYTSVLTRHHSGVAWVIWWSLMPAANDELSIFSAVTSLKDS